MFLKNILNNIKIKESIIFTSIFLGYFIACMIFFLRVLLFFMFILQIFFVVRSSSTHRKKGLNLSFILHKN